MRCIFTPRYATKAYAVIVKKLVLKETRIVVDASRSLSE
jgi:hypothetical protein